MSNVFLPAVYASFGTFATMVSKILELIVPSAYSPLPLGVIETAAPHSPAPSSQACTVEEFHVRPSCSTSVMTAFGSVAPIWFAITVQVIVRLIGL